MHHTSQCTSFSKKQWNQYAALVSAGLEKSSWSAPPATINCCVRGSRGKTCWMIPEISDSGSSRLIRSTIFHVRDGRLADNNRMRRDFMALLVGLRRKELLYLFK